MKEKNLSATEGIDASPVMEDGTAFRPLLNFRNETAKVSTRFQELQNSKAALVLILIPIVVIRFVVKSARLV